MQVARKFYTPVVIVHPRGHVVPALAGPHLAVLRAFLSSFLPQQPEQQQQPGQHAYTLQSKL